MTYTPEHVMLGAVALLGISFVVIVLPALKKHTRPYERINSILTPAEQHFYKVLFSALNGRVLIMAKVRIADVLRVKHPMSDKAFLGRFSKISQKHIDFVLIDLTTFKTLCVIELDDKSHSRPHRILRDRFIETPASHSRQK